MPTLTDLRQFAKYHLVRRVHRHPAREAELGVVPLGYEPEAFEREIRAFEARFDVREETRVAYRGETRPIFSVRSHGFASARRRLLVLSGVHGNEQAGIVCVPEILARYEREKPDVGLFVLTPVNPIGAAELSRFNADGYDINRDFVRFYTEEARLVRHAIETARPDFVISLHEGPQDATFMFANQNVDAALAQRLLDALEAGGTVLAKNDYFGTTLRPAGLAPSTAGNRFALALWAAALGMMATSAYTGGRGIPELVLESSWRSPDRAARVRPHVDLCAAVLGELARS